jgi:formylglycine-generating enzyme required for sulfatase activity
MLGNVWEWCLDGPRTYQDRPAIDPHGLPAHPDKDRVLRGGSWSSIARRVRAAYRYRHHPAYGSHDIGFRCAHAPS